MDDLFRDYEDKAKKIVFLAEFFGACGSPPGFRGVLPMFPEGGITQHSATHDRATLRLTGLAGRMLNYVDELKNNCLKEHRHRLSVQASRQELARTLDRVRMRADGVFGDTVKARVCGPLGELPGPTAGPAFSLVWGRVEALNVHSEPR